MPWRPRGVSPASCTQSLAEKTIAEMAAAAPSELPERLPACQMLYDCSAQMSKQLGAQGVDPKAKGAQEYPRVGRKAGSFLQSLWWGQSPGEERSAAALALVATPGAKSPA